MPPAETSSHDVIDSQLSPLGSRPLTLTGTLRGTRRVFRRSFPSFFTGLAET